MKMSLDLMQNMSIDQIIQLYNDGYTLEDSKIINIQNLPPSIIFHVTCSSAACGDAHVIINNTDQGVTDATGKFTLNSSPEVKINYLITKLGYNDYIGSVVAGKSGDITDVYIDLTLANQGIAYLKFNVTEPGTSVQVPSYGSRIILDNQEFGLTDKYGILTVQNLAAKTTIPFLINKAGFPESFGIAQVGSNGTTTDINVDLQLFPTKTWSIVRAALIGSIFLTSVGIIVNHFVTIAREKQIRY